MRPDWNLITREEKDAIIRPLWGEGKSGSEIAAYFVGATRNMIIGAVHRGKMPARAKPERHKSTKTKRPPDQVRAKARAIKPNRNTIVRTEKPAEPEFHASKWLDEFRPPIPGHAPISILELPNKPTGICRMPVVGGYCGISCGEQVYCPTHHRFTHTQKEKART